MWSGGLLDEILFVDPGNSTVWGSTEWGPSMCGPAILGPPIGTRVSSYFAVDSMGVYGVGAYNRATDFGFGGEGGPTVCSPRIGRLISDLGSQTAKACKAGAYGVGSYSQDTNFGFENSDSEGLQGGGLQGGDLQSGYRFRI